MQRFKNGVQRDGYSGPRQANRHGATPADASFIPSSTLPRFFSHKTEKICILYVIALPCSQLPTALFLSSVILTNSFPMSDDRERGRVKRLQHTVSRCSETPQIHNSTTGFESFARLEGLPKGWSSQFNSPHRPHVLTLG
jgi:hypothetical protein